MLDLCKNEKASEQIPDKTIKQKSLEEILRNEFAWTLEQVAGKTLISDTSRSL